MDTNIIYIILIIFASVCALILLTAYICFLKVFLSRPKSTLREDEYDIPSDESFKPHSEKMISWAKTKRALPYRELSVTSFDGLTLKAKYYEYEKNAPIEILFHGYKGNAERDLSGAIERCAALGRSAILVDQRAAGSSEGKVITFGINECRDCLCWVKKVIETFGEDTEIVLGGISMGAATVVMASAEDLPKNVKYVLADCPYTSPEEIIKKVVKGMRLPTKLLYPMIVLGAKLFGHFDLSSNSPIKAVKNSRVPIIFLHGTDDGFVPAEMSERLYKECASAKKLVKVKGADHGLAYLVAPEKYISAIKEFENDISVFQHQ